MIMVMVEGSAEDEVQSAAREMVTEAAVVKVELDSELDWQVTGEWNFWLLFSAGDAAEGQYMATSIMMRGVDELKKLATEVMSGLTNEELLEIISTREPVQR